MNPKSLMYGVAALLWSFLAAAQGYPTKPVTIVVPFAAGGPTDTVTRVVGQQMSKSLGQTVLVENVGGVGGNLGNEKVAKAQPDGYTLLLMHIGISTSATLYRSLRYNALTDLEPIGMVTTVPMTIIARKDFPPNNIVELVTYVKANKEKVSYANAGIGAASHLCGMLFMSAIETDLLTVPYKGTAPAMTDLLGGQVDFMCDQTTNTTSQIKGGKVKVYGVTSKSRVASLPDVPTMEEGGFKGFEVGIWHGMWAPKGTPKPIIDKLNAALSDALDNEEVKKRFAELGTVPEPAERRKPEVLRAHLKAEVEKWAPIIKKASIYAD
jgi:tripartite-type tricarboxylate transporter receptor subunit TctC